MLPSSTKGTLQTGLVKNLEMGRWSSIFSEGPVSSQGSREEEGGQRPPDAELLAWMWGKGPWAKALGRLWKLAKARRWILSWSLQGKLSPAHTCPEPT